MAVAAVVEMLPVRIVIGACVIGRQLRSVNLIGWIPFVRMAVAHGIRNAADAQEEHRQHHKIVKKYPHSWQGYPISCWLVCDLCSLQTGEASGGSLLRKVFCPPCAPCEYAGFSTRFLTSAARRSPCLSYSAHVCRLRTDRFQS